MRKQGAHAEVAVHRDGRHAFHELSQADHREVLVTLVEGPDLRGTQHATERRGPGDQAIETLMAGEIENGVALDLERVHRLQSSPRKANQVNVMAFCGIRDAGPDDLAGTCVQACQQETDGGAAVRFSATWRGFVHNAACLGLHKVYYGFP